jgi:hypothetical protein
MKLNENPSSGSRIVPCVQTGGRTDLTKLIVAYRNFANALKNKQPFSSYDVPSTCFGLNIAILKELSNKVF